MCSIREVLSAVEASLSDLGDPDTSLGSAAADEFLALRELAERLDVVSLRWLAALDSAGISAQDGSVSTAGWVRRHTGCSARSAAADVRLARRLHSDEVRRMSATAALLDEGRLSIGHARAIARETTTMDGDAFAMAEPVVATTAVGLSVDPAAQVVAQVCRHVEELHAGAQDDPAATRRAAATAQRHLHLSPCGDMYAVDGLLTVEAGQALKAVLEPLARPVPATDQLPDLRTATQRRADALGEAAQMLLASGRLPVHGGQRPQVTVVVDLESLVAGRGGRYVDGRSMSWAETGKVLCDARVGWLATRDLGSTPTCMPPAVDGGGAGDAPLGELVRDALRRVSPALGGLPTQVLDAGRTERLVSAGQRHALAVRDRGCVFPGCDRPPEWCDAHHVDPWVGGGRSDLENLVLVCARHHTAIHDGWHLARAPDGTIGATPPAGW